MRRVAAAGACALVLMAGLAGAAVTAEVAAAAPASAAATTSASLTVSNPRDVVVEPTTGRVFVSGGDAIDVFAPDGTRTTTIAGVPGAGGLDIAGGTLWATTSVKALVAVDLSTLTVARSLPTTYALRPGLAVVGTKAFARMDNPFFPGTDAVIGIDLVTGATKVMPGSHAVRIHRAADVTDRVYVVAMPSTGLSSVRTLSTTPPYPVISEWDAQGLGASEVSDDGAVLWGTSTSGGPTSLIREFDLTTGQVAAVGGYGDDALNTTIAATSARAGLIAGSSMYTVTFNQVGEARSVGRQQVKSDNTDRTPRIEFSADGNVLWRLTLRTLERIVFEPAIDQLMPSSVPAQKQARIDVTGTMLSGTTAVTVGGVAAPIVDTSSTGIAFTVPPGVAPGVHPVVLRHPLGDRSTTLTVTDPLGTLNGTVRVAGTMTSGVTVQLSGGGLSAPRMTTSRADGGYEFRDLPVVTAPYRVEFGRPAATGPGLVVERVALRVNSSTNVGADLRAAPRPAAASTVTKLPGSSADLFGRFVTDQGGGTTFVQKGSELLAVDRDGDLIGRVRGFGDPRGIAVGGRSIFVASATVGEPGARVTRVDAASFTVTGEWAIGSIGEGRIAYGGGRLFVATGDPSTLQVLDLATGVVQPVEAPGGVTSLAPVGGAPDQLLVSTGTALHLLDVRAPMPSTLAVLDEPGGVVAADAMSDRLWAGSGVEYELSDLTPTGRDFGVQGTPTASASHGGIVAFGAAIVSSATGEVAHVLGSAPVSGLAATGEVAFAPTATGDLSVHDLTPHATGVSEPPTFVDGTLTVSGWGLLPTTEAALDGVPVPFTVRSSTQVDVQTATVAGPHVLTLTTPWGTTAPVPFVAHSRPAPSTVTSVDPVTVGISGGPVTIRGTDFTWATGIDVGGIRVAGFTVVDDATMTFVAPPHPAGAVPIRVDNLLHTGTPGAALTYAYSGVPPTVTSLAPNDGLTWGWTDVTITGTNLEATQFVTFDGVPAEAFVVVSPTEVIATSPPHVAGAAAVQVTTNGGISAVGPQSTFTYRVPPPSTTKVDPATGPTTGGVPVTLTGHSFTGATEVRFGSIPATSFSVLDDRTIVALSPPRSAAGTVNVLVTTPDGTDEPHSRNRFTYTVPPVGSISGMVRDTAGPLANMVVMVSPASAPGLTTAVATDADGSFSTPSLPVGSYKVYVFDGRLIFGVPAERVGEWYQAGGPGTASFAAASTVVVAGGEDAVLGPVVLDAVAPGSIAGVVTDGSAPLAGVVVLVSPVSNLEASAFAVTGADGRFSVGGLAPGSYKVMAVHGPALFGLPAEYATEFYDDVEDSPGAFATAPAVSVAASTATTLRPIALRRL